MLSKLLNALRGKRWRHNKLFPHSFKVTQLDTLRVAFDFMGQHLVFPKASQLSHQFSNHDAHLLLSGPSIQTIEQPDLLNQAYCFAVNGSPSYFLQHHLNYDGYVIDDPRFIEQYGQRAIEFAARATHVFLSYRSIFLLLKQNLDISQLNIYVFDYQFMPFRQNRPAHVRPYFAQSLNEGFGKSDTIAHIALQLAYGMGFEQVALFGLDLTLSGRFYQEDTPAPQHLHDNWQKGIIEPFLEAQKITQTNTWTLVNCSLNSLLPETIIPKCDPNIYLAQQKSSDNHVSIRSPNNGTP